MDVPGAECAADAECTQPNGCETADGAHCWAGQCHYRPAFGHCDDGDACTVDGCTGDGECTHDSTTNLGRACSTGGYAGTCTQAGARASCLKNAGQACLADHECAQGLCECGNATCTTRVCTAAECDCRFDKNGDGTCDGNLERGVDDADDTCGPNRTCSGYGRCTSPNGVACTDPASCDSGFCEDEVCCDQNCSVPCMTCAGNPSGRGVGACAAVSDGLDPRAECAPGLGCSGSGTCWVWGTAGLLEQEDGHLSLEPLDGTSRTSDWVLGADEDGNLVVVWAQSDGTTMNALASHYRVGVGWTGPVPLESDAGMVMEVGVAVSAGGNAVAWWAQVNDDGSWEIKESRYTHGMGWSGAQVLDNALPIGLNIRLDGDGNGWAVYERSVPEGTEIVARRFDSNVGWAVPSTIGSSSATMSFSSESVDWALAADGSALAAWLQDQDGISRVSHARLAADTRAWTTATTLSASGRNAQRPHVAGGDDGWLVVWEEPTSDDKLGYAHLDADGLLLAQDTVPNTELASLGGVWRTSHGHFVVIFSAPVFGRGTAHAKFFDPLGGWLASERIDRPDQGHSSSTVVAVTAPNTLVALMRQGRADGTGSDLVFNRFTPAAGWSGAQALRSQVIGMLHTIASLPPSGAVAVWTDAVQNEPVSLWHAILAP